MSFNQPLVSIILTSYNYDKYIGQTIESVLSQSYQNWELIVSDDGSRDRSLEIIYSYQDNRIQVLTSETNQGAGQAYNKAYALCQGKYICSLDSDDYIAPDKLEKQVAFLESHPETDILGTFIIEINAKSQIIHETHEAWFNQDLNLNYPENWIWRNHLCHSSMMMRKELHDRVGLFNNQLIHTPDYEFWIRCFVSQCHFDILTENLTFYRSHGENITHKNPPRAFLETAYIFVKYFKRFLVEKQRNDLINQYVFLFLKNENYSNASITIKSNLLQQLVCTEAVKFQDFDSFAQILQNSSNHSLLVNLLDEYKLQVDGTQVQLQDTRSQLNHLLVRIQKLQEDKDWLQSQYNVWQQKAKESQRAWEESRLSVQELQEGKDWLQSQYNVWQQKAKEAQRAWEKSQLSVQELQEGKDWLQSQYNIWRQKAEESHTQVERLQLQLQQAQAELERSQSHLQQAQAELERSQSHLQQTQAELEELYETFKKLENSKLWKLNKVWHSLKARIFQKIT